MAEITIQPGGNVSAIGSSQRYNIASQLGIENFPPFDVRSGVDPIDAAGIESYSGTDGTLSALSSQGRLEKTSVDSALSALAAGEIAVVDEYTIAHGAAGAIDSTLSLHIQYQAQGEQRRKL